MIKMRYWFTDSDANLSTVNALPTMADKLKRIKDAMQVDVNAVDFDDVRSIPDTWYIHRIYEMMMLHPINGVVYEKYQAAVLRHWHAICAVYFVGAQKFGLQIHSSALDNDTFDKMEAITPAQIQTKSIMQSTWNARPTRMISRHPFYDPNSIKIHYIVNPATDARLPFAMSSATTFLVPTADAWKNLYAVCPGIPWIRAVRNAEERIIKYQVLDPAYNAGMLTLSERQSFRNSLNQIAETAVSNSVPEEQNATETLAKLIRTYIDDPAGLLAPPGTPDIFPDDRKLYYVAMPGNPAATDDSDPQIGGVDDLCTCSQADEMGTFTNYLVSLPVSAQAKDWILNGAGKYQISVTMATGSPQFTAVYTYGGVIHQKTFCQAAANTLEVTANDMGISTMWPRYKMDNWTRYYVFREEFRGARVGAGLTYAIVPEEKPVDERTYSVKDTDAIANEDTGAITYSEFERWPQSWFLIEKDGAGNTRQVGYFLTRAIPAPPQVPGRTFTAAIDFGTSSTMIYGRHNDIATALGGANLWSLPLFAGMSRSSEIHRFFIPSTQVPSTIMPLQSILAIENENKAPILLGNWSYFRQSAEALSRRTLPNPFAVHSNLKWDPLSSFYTTSYLQIVSHMVALEARSLGCAILKAIITYPSAMTSWDSYLQKMQTQLKEACASAGLTYENDSTVTVTESEAVARRMYAIVPQATQFCSIDIGGGTSDIFLFFHDGNPTKRTWDGYESSLLCGARDILLEGFVRDQNCLFDLIELVADDPVMKEMRAQVPQIDSWRTQLGREEVQRNIEFLLATSFIDTTRKIHDAGEELRLRAVSEDGLKRPSIAKLRKRIAFRLAAILYYAGLMTRGTGTRIDELHLQFAGNGSKTLLWIAEDTTKIKAFLSAMFNAGAGLDPTAPDYAVRAQRSTNIAFSQYHKHEVSDGAMREPIAMGTHVNEILAGERVQLYNAAGEVFEVWSMCRNIADELFNNASSFVPSNDTLRAFVESFRVAMITSLAIPLRQDEFDPAIADASGIRQKIKDKVAAIANREVPDKKSFFMVGVDELCEQYFI